MSSGPLPPHERPWRHPSELVGPPPPPPATRNGRLILVSTASAALLLVGVLAVTVTPSKVAHRDTAVAGASAVDPTHGEPPRAAPVSRGGGPAHATPSLAPSPGADRANAYVVTPVAAGYGLTTRSALADPGAEPRLPTGDATQLALLLELGPVAVVSIPQHGAAPLDIGEGGHPDRLDGDDRYVVVDGSTIPYETARLTDVLEGAPVVDHRGALVGLITNTERGPALVAVSISGGIAPPRGGAAMASTRKSPSDRERVAATATDPTSSSAVTVAGSEPETSLGDDAAALPSTLVSPTPAAHTTDETNSAAPVASVPVTPDATVASE